MILCLLLSCAVERRQKLRRSGRSQRTCRPPSWGRGISPQRCRSIRARHSGSKCMCCKGNIIAHDGDGPDFLVGEKPTKTLKW